jgi:ABC-type multidrug transport system fused ATPase/permease subunit
MPTGVAMLPHLRRFIAIYQGYERPFWIAQGLQGCSAIFTLLIPLMSQRLLDEGLLVGDRDATIASVLWMVLFAILASVFSIANSWYAVQFGERTGHAVRLYLYRKIQTFSFSNLDQFATSGLLVRMTSDVNTIKTVVQSVVLLVAQAPIMFLGTLVLVYRNSPSLAWILWLVVAVTLVVLGLCLGQIGTLFELRQAKLDEVNRVLQEDLSGIRVVKAFGQEDYEVRRYDRANQAFRAASLQPMRIAAFVQPTLFAIVNLATVAVLWFGGNPAQPQGATVGEILAFSQYLATVLIPLVSLAILIPQVSFAEASAQRLFEVVDATPTVAAPTTPVALPPAQGRIVFDRVSFAYPGPPGQPPTPVLKEISLTIEPGQTVAFLGATGSGKSTLVNLIPRFYDVTGGRITLDGVDVRDLALGDLHRRVAIALQEAVLFSGTVRDNVCYGQPEATEEAMVRVAAAADAHGFVSAIPEGYDAPVARRGTNFSGGQRQRLAIARALAPEPQVVILDDSTSALDMETEARVQDSIQRLMTGATTIFVAQRISTVISCDRIFLLEAGELVASGTHSELVRTSPLYQDICASQLGGVPA